MKKISVLLLILFLIVSFFVYSNQFIVQAENKMIVVPDDFPTIQEAIENAEEGDTVFVKNGTYNENVVINNQGDFIIVWTSGDQDGSGFGVFAQRFNAQGEPRGKLPW